MVQKTVIWRSRKSFCTVVDDDMLSSFPSLLASSGHERLKKVSDSSLFVLYLCVVQ